MYINKTTYFLSKKIHKHLLKQGRKTKSATLVEYIKDNLVESVKYVKNNSKDEDVDSNLNTLVKVIKNEMSLKEINDIYDANYWDLQNKHIDFYSYTCLPTVVAAGLFIGSCITNPIVTNNFFTSLGDKLVPLIFTSISVIVLSSIALYSISEDYKEKAEKMKSEKKDILRRYANS